MKYWFQVCTPHTPDISSPIIILHFDDCRYLFNCPEGSTRVFAEHGIKLGKIRHVFTTRADWDVVGGVAGFLTWRREVEEVYNETINIYGPGKLRDMIGDCGAFSPAVNNTDFSTPCCFEGFQDRNIRVEAVKLSCAATMNGKRKLEAPSELGDEENMRKSGDLVAAYIIRGPEFPGRLDAKLAIELGVPAGKDLGKLKSGCSVTTPNGNVVHPHQVLGKAHPPSISILLDVPDVSYINSLLRSSTFKALLSPTSPDFPYIRNVFHLAGHGVLDDRRYSEWMRAFPGEATHFVSSRDHPQGDSAFPRFSTRHSRYTLMDPNIFSRRRVFSSKPFPAPIASISSRMEPLMQVVVGPKASIEAGRPLVDPLSADGEISKWVKSVPKFRKDIEEHRVKMEAITPNQFYLTCLGTASASPGVFRNVSGNVLTIPEHGYIIVDCGEGSFSQIRHVVPRLRELLKPKETAPSESDDIAQQLSDDADHFFENCHLIFISHMHADHHVGLIGFLVERHRWADRLRKQNRGSPPPITIIGPPALEEWLNNYTKFQPIGISEGEINCVASGEQITPRNPYLPGFREERGLVFSTGDPRVRDSCERLGLDNVTTVRVDHCRWAYGVVLDHLKGWRFVYSGDTRPCPALVKAGQGATTLLHEATFERERRMAVEKKHSTCQEAMEVALEMEAKSVVLTHFSQRYGKADFLSEARRGPPVCAAQDLLTVGLPGEVGKAQEWIDFLGKRTYLPLPGIDEEPLYHKMLRIA